MVDTDLGIGGWPECCDPRECQGSVQREVFELGSNRTRTVVKMGAVAREAATLPRDLLLDERAQELEHDDRKRLVTADDEIAVVQVDVRRDAPSGD